MKIYLDTETLGLVGHCRLIQYSLETDPKNVKFIKLPPNWHKDKKTVAEVDELLALLNSEDNQLVGFNLAFDLFQMYRVWHIRNGWDWKSRDNVVEPFRCHFLDLQLHSMFKSILAPFAFSKKASNSVARLKRIPVGVSQAVSDYITYKLEKEVANITKHGIEIKPHIHAVKGREDVVDLSWTTNANMRLKTLMKAYGVMDTMSLEEGDWLTPSNIKNWYAEKGLKLPEDLDTSELLHVPYGEGKLYDLLDEVNLKTLENPNSSFWKYAKDDIIYLVDLERHLGFPQSNANDYCTDCVAYTKYHGFPLDFEAVQQCIEEYKADMAQFDLKFPDGTALDPNSPTQVLKFLKLDFDELKSSDKKTLTKLAYECDYEPAIKVLKYRKAFQRYNQVIKLTQSETKRGHPEFRIVGTATNRMSGSGGFNWQGISKPIKGQVTIRDCILTSAGGDMSTLEVVLAAIIYEDDLLLAEITDGLELHSLNTVSFHPQFKGKITYETALAIRADRNHPLHNDFDKARTEIKAVTFGTLYGAEAPKIAEQLEISEELAQEIIDGFYGKYIGIRKFKDKLEAQFCTGDTDTWARGSVRLMDTGITDRLGHTRKWTLEASIAHLFWTASDEEFLPPWTKNEKVVRTKAKGPQTVMNAVRSAMLGAALTIQKAVARQATNSIVQSVGAELTKRLQVRVYRATRMPLIQVHDELQCVRGYEDRFDVADKVCQDFIAEYSKLFKNLGFKLERTERWSDK